jgi:hypothetical protein
VKRFKIKYNEDRAINKTVEIKATDKKEALYLFNMNYRNANEVVSVEEVV